MKQIITALLLVACAQLSVKYSQAQDPGKVIISIELKNATLGKHLLPLKNRPPLSSVTRPLTSAISNTSITSKKMCR